MGSEAAFVTPAISITAAASLCPLLFIADTMSVCLVWAYKQQQKIAAAAVSVRT